MDDGAQLLVLLGSRDKINAEIADRKAALAEIEAAIATTAQPYAEASFKREGKTDGTVHFAVGNRIYKAVIGKTVKYDSAALQSIAGSIPWSDAEKIFKIEFDVPEKAYKAITNEDLKKRIAAARTVKYGAPKITAKED